MIAIALACNPNLLIADEPTTALDVTIQAQVLRLMKNLQAKLNTSIILITHDLGIVAGIAQRVIVMYAGKIVESGKIRDIYYHAGHPYTWGLMKSIPRLDIDRKQPLTPIFGTPPDLLSPPPGCPFADRCNYAMKICSEEMPPSYSINDGHYCSCWLFHPEAPPFANAVKERSVGNG